MKRLFESLRPATPAWAVLLCLAIGSAAHARQLPEEKELIASAPVSYADLDLTQDADVKILLDRIEKAAYRVCGGNPRWHPAYGVMPGYTAQVFKECRADAIARAIDEIDAPTLSQARLDAVRM